MRRIGCLVIFGAASFLYSGTAHAQSCRASYNDAQENEKSGHLLEARGQYSSCAKSACGAFLLNECTTRHARLDSDIPSVVLVVTQESGKPEQNVRVTLDGEPFATSVDGRSLRVDPGLHVFVFTSERGTTATEELLILQGDRNRRIAVSLPDKHREGPEGAAPAQSANETIARDAAIAERKRQLRQRRPLPRAEPSAEPQQGTGVPALSWVLGGVGMLGGGGYALLTAWGKKDNDALQQQCAPSCQQSSVDQVKQRFLAAEISLGVGVAALGGALLVYAFRGSNAESPPAERAYAVAVQPAHAGAVANFSGSF